eukprot:GHVQ01017140.1.p1 GENE.GHVQ01017140.1~~GHVQ01017140.1.p1  ORF type:complete len:119 (+),score=14.88 GHVQ01017140.1:163-519(+)
MSISPSSLNRSYGVLFDKLYRLGGIPTLTFRGNSLMVQCIEGAVIHFAAKDIAALAVFGIGYCGYCRSFRSAVSQAGSEVGDVNGFSDRKGIPRSEIKVENEGGRMREITLKGKRFSQ